MPVNLSIKNVPDGVAEALRQRAAGHHRSLQGELMVILEESLGRKPNLTPLELLSKLCENGLKSPEESLRLVREDRRMRTTLVIDDDVLDHARVLASKRRVPFREVVNEALRVGLSIVEAPTKQKKYRTTPRPMGLRPGRNLDNIHELLTQVEGENRR